MDKKVSELLAAWTPFCTGKYYRRSEYSWTPLWGP